MRSSLFEPTEPAVCTYALVGALAGALLGMQTEATATVGGAPWVVAVTGGRQAADPAPVWAALDGLPRRPAALLHGGARGVDALAARWAAARGVPCREFRAEWGRLGRGAGPYRNEQMLAEGPALLLAFHGGIGTANCVAAAHRRGIPVQYV